MNTEYSQSNSNIPNLLQEPLIHNMCLYILSSAEYLYFLVEHITFDQIEDSHEFQRRLYKTLYYCFTDHPNPLTLDPCSIYLSCTCFLLEKLELEDFLKQLTLKIEKNGTFDLKQIQNIYEQLCFIFDDSKEEKEQEKECLENDTPNLEISDTDQGFEMCSNSISPEYNYSMDADDTFEQYFSF